MSTPTPVIAAHLGDHDATKADDIQKKRLLMKETWLKGSKQMCGKTKGPPRHKEIWWWKRWLSNERYHNA